MLFLSYGTKRKSRYTVILPIKKQTSAGMIHAIELFLSEYQNYVQSLTFDNGSEFISWQFLECIQVKYGKKRILRTHIHHMNVARMNNVTNL